MRKNKNGNKKSFSCNGKGCHCHSKKKNTGWYAPEEREDDEELEDVEDDELEDEEDEYTIWDPWDDEEDFDEDEEDEEKDEGDGLDEIFIPREETFITSSAELKSDFYTFVDLKESGFFAKETVWMTTSQAAKWYRVNPRTVRRWIEKEMIKYVNMEEWSTKYLVEVDLGQRWFEPSD